MTPETTATTGFEADLGAVLIRNGEVILVREHLHPSFRQRLALWLITHMRRLTRWS